MSLAARRTVLGITNLLKIVYCTISTLYDVSLPVSTADFGVVFNPHKYSKYYTMFEKTLIHEDKIVQRMKRAFKWIVHFRDFPEGCIQEFSGEQIQKDALTFFTKGKAEFYYGNLKRPDRIPGILSSEQETWWDKGTFTIHYKEPTTRVCIARHLNKGLLPAVKKLEFNQGETFILNPPFKGLMCLGSIQLDDRIFNEEQTFNIISENKIFKSLSKVYILDFTNS